MKALVRAISGKQEVNVSPEQLALQEVVQTTLKIALYAISTLAIGGLLVGFLGREAQCDQYLAEWNAVAGILAAVLAGICGACLYERNAIKVCSKFILADCNTKDLFQQGNVAGLLTVGVLLLPLFVVGWDVYGMICAATSVACKTTAPRLFVGTLVDICVSLTITTLLILHTFAKVAAIKEYSLARCMTCFCEPLQQGVGALTLWLPNVKLPHLPKFLTISYWIAGSESETERLMS